MIDPFYEANKDILENLFYSKLKNEEIYKQLQIVDAQSAAKTHPNDRRKLCRFVKQTTNSLLNVLSFYFRALEIYYQFGVNKSTLIEAKNEKTGSGLYHGALRYTNPCILFLNCENEILNTRLDDRIDEMIKKGLIDELKMFSMEIKSKIDSTQSIAEFSQQFQVGIFQAIGFKEFNEYLNGGDEKSYENGIENMKLITRKYAKRQQRWIFNRFIKRK